tara:strand:- start:176 stop:517 length:342 start_codon:yes stop_codon:yes gene_type:complete
MKKKLLAILRFMAQFNTLTEVKNGETVPKLPRKTKDTAKRKGFYITNPNAVSPAQISELETLVSAWKEHLVVEYNPIPRVNKSSGEVFPPSLFIGQPFASDTEEELLDFGDDL